MMDMAVGTRELTRSFNGIRAVDGLDLNVPKGAVYGFLGPNGAGKTTTLKMIAGMLRPTSGEIYISGKKVAFGSIRNRNDIGFLPDVPGFYDWMNAAEYLQFCGSLFGMSGSGLSGRISELLKTTGLADTGKKKIGGFSRGMKQRLGIAQALINDPEIALLDEPVSALDPIGRKEVMDIITGLSGKVTVFFSTHVLADVERICDRVIIIKQGKAVLEDTIENIKKMNPKRMIEIETAGDAREKLLEITGRIGWVENAIFDSERKARVTVSDLDKAMLELPGLINGGDVAIRRFTVQEPTLEDIFIKAVG